MITYVHRKPVHKFAIATIFIIAHTGSNPNVPQWANVKNVTKPYMEYHSATKRNKLLIDLKHIMLSEKSQSPKITLFL